MSRLNFILCDAPRFYKTYREKFPELEKAVVDSSNELKKFINNGEFVFHPNLGLQEKTVKYHKIWQEMTQLCASFKELYEEYMRRKEPHQFQGNVLMAEVNLHITELHSYLEESHLSKRCDRLFEIARLLDIVPPHRVPSSFVHEASKVCESVPESPMTQPSPTLQAACDVYDMKPSVVLKQEMAKQLEADVKTAKTTYEQSEVKLAQSHVLVEKEEEKKKSGISCVFRWGDLRESRVG